MTKRSTVKKIEKAEPAFIKRFKVRAGMGYDPSIEDKFTPSCLDTKEKPLNDDDLPTVVCNEDIDKDEINQHLRENYGVLKDDKSKELCKSKQGDSFTYEKPNLVKAQKNAKVFIGSKSKPKTKTKSISRAVKNNNLLSFDQDD
ncbi:hypothetical protein A3Q56_05237 [Intoshia linei]|uniref:DUF4604 domain-containing protein n=1 Tax=Intoshia linei TaxID=1819745 RepID=A0A177B0T2_9BILA|nr:hypothetical protein A3Q56_05237 [Intoshia linei]